jgi:hydroxyacylglutathione hydrolase
VGRRTLGGVTDQLYFRQLLSGLDFALEDPLAQQMANFVYAIGDRETGECLIVDPAYDVNELADMLAADGMTITGVLATHYHADHIGGSLMGYPIQGVTTLLERVGVKIHVQAEEAEYVKKQIGISDSDLAVHAPGDVVMVGSIPVTLMHTPGHTPGSQCFLVDGRCISGDTLFLDGCGRTDLPGSNPDHMYDSLTKLAALPDATIVYPGHNYSARATSNSIAKVRDGNVVYRPKSREQWLQMFAS